MASPTLFVLALDSIDWQLIQQWSAEGRLPVLTKLIRESGVLSFAETNRPLPGSVWTDIATGVSAAQHGFVHEVQLAAGSYRTEPVDASRVAVAPFYKFLSDAGVRCAVVDFPVDYPLPDFNGLQVVDWGTEFKLWRFETRPREFAAQLLAKYERHPLHDYPGTRTGLADLLALKHELARGIEIKRRFAVDLIRAGEYEFIFFNFAELHKGGHFFWKFHDRGHPDFTDAEPQLVDSLRELYEHMDRAVGSVLEALDERSDLIVVTDRGMYAEQRGDHLVDGMLMKWGLAAPRGGSVEKPAKEFWRSRMLGQRKVLGALRAVGRALPDGLREALLPLHRSMIGAPPPLDWKKTRVFRLPSVGNSYLRINLAGREPLGVVSPGHEYDALLAELATRFRALVNPKTGEAAVEDVYFPGKLFSGPKSRELPDVAIVWNSRAPIDAVAFDDIGVISGRQMSDRSGNHRPEGFALLRGPSFANLGGVRNADARELAPLILERFGVDIPAHFEMRSSR